MNISRERFNRILNENKCIILERCPGCSTHFIIEEKNESCLGPACLVEETDGVLLRYSVVSESSHIISGQWVRDFLSKPGMRQELSLFFYLYYWFLYERPDTAEYVLMYEYLQKQYGSNELEQILKDLMIRYGYKLEYSYVQTKYVNKSILQWKGFDSKRILLLYISIKATALISQKIVRRMRVLETRITYAKRHKRMLNVLFSTQLFSQVLPIKAQNSASGCLIYRGLGIDNKEYFIKGGEIKGLHTVQVEKKASRLLKDNNNGNYLVDLAGEDEDYVIFPFTADSSLEEIMHSHSLDEQFVFQLRDFFIEILDELFEKRIVHRDIRTGNILVHCDNGRWHFTLIDFGCAIINGKRAIANAYEFDDYHTAGINCKAGAQHWDDAGSALLILSAFAKETGCSQEVIRPIKERIDRLVEFE